MNLALKRTELVVNFLTTTELINQLKSLNFVLIYILLFFPPEEQRPRYNHNQWRKFRTNDELKDKVCAKDVRLILAGLFTLETTLISVKSIVLFLWFAFVVLMILFCLLISCMYNDSYKMKTLSLSVMIFSRIPVIIMLKYNWFAAVLSKLVDLKFWDGHDFQF